MAMRANGLAAAAARLAGIERPRAAAYYRWSTTEQGDEFAHPAQYRIVGRRDREAGVGPGPGVRGRREVGDQHARPRRAGAPPGRRGPWRVRRGGRPPAGPACALAARRHRNPRPARGGPPDPPGLHRRGHRPHQPLRSRAPHADAGPGGAVQRQPERRGPQGAGADVGRRSACRRRADRLRRVLEPHTRRSRIVPGPDAPLVRRAFRWRARGIF